MNMIQAEIRDNIGIIFLNRPKALNAINQQMVDEIDQQLTEWQNQSLRAIILTGRGKAFAAGADIKQMSDFDAEQAEFFAQKGQASLRKLENFPAPTIAAVNGYALGGGCELALCCDFILAGSRAKFGQPEVNLGVIPGFGGTQRLIRRVGRQRALELMMTGRIISAAEATTIGLSLQLVEGDVLNAALELATTIAKKGPVAVQLVKQVVDKTDRMPTEQGLSVEAAAFGRCFSTQDQKEGMQAFMEKRKAQFTGK